MDLLLDWQHYHRLNITLLSVVGLWPYGNKLVLGFQRLVGSFFVFAACFCQVATFFTVDYTNKVLLKNVSCTFVGCGALLKYISFVTASDRIKKVTQTINDDLKELANKEDIRIIEKYVELGKFHTKGFAMFICPAGAFLMFVPLSSKLLDIVVPLNESRNRTIPIKLEMFFDQEKYFFLSTFLYNGLIIVTGFVFISTESLVIVYIQHACALFEATRRRIRNFMCTTGTASSKRSSDMVIMAQVVDIHSRAIRHCKIIRDDFCQSYIILLVFGMISLTAHLVRCTETFAAREFKELLSSAIFCIAILCYMFYLNFISQSILNSSVGVFHDLYDTNWYASPSSTRKLVLFCMLYSIKPVAVDVCKLYHPSYEGFSQIAKMAMSYTTALYSVQ